MSKIREMEMEWSEIVGSYMYFRWFGLVWFAGVDDGLPGKKLDPANFSSIE